MVRVVSINPANNRCTLEGGNYGRDVLFSWDDTHGWPELRAACPLPSPLMCQDILPISTTLVAPWRLASPHVTRHLSLFYSVVGLPVAPAPRAVGLEVAPHTLNLVMHPVTLPLIGRLSRPFLLVTVLTVPSAIPSSIGTFDQPPLLLLLLCPRVPCTYIYQPPCLISSLHLLHP